MQLLEVEPIWIPWVEAALISLLLIISAIQPRAIALSMQALVSPIQRRYASGSTNPILYILRFPYQIGSVSLSMLIAAAAIKGNSEMLQWVQYLKAIGIVAGVLIVKMAVDKWIQLTFHYSVNEATYHQYHSELFQAVSIVLWMLILISPWMSAVAQWLIPGMVIAVYCGWLWWKIMQVFGWNAKHICYTTLYILHLEVLPIVVGMVGIERFVI